MHKPQKTFADYLVIAVSPVLVMALVGSLAFFLIQVFYRGEAVNGVRWVMFWFVFAIVLVSRVAIEHGTTTAQLYGAALAATMCFYLTYTHRIFILGAALLGLAWWCAHKLTRDCTFIDEDEDASGESVLQGLWRRIEEAAVPPGPPPPQPPRSARDLMAAANLAERSKRRAQRKPGRWVVYFSLAALPLFGLGQLLLPRDDPGARKAGFAFLAIYLCAALSLLVTTSFLGLRRYLRQRSVEMPANVAVGWIRLGIIITAVVLLLALVLPRPGAQRTWSELTHHVERKLHDASKIALPFNPPGEGEGATGFEPPERPSPIAQPNADTTAAASDEPAERRNTVGGSDGDADVGDGPGRRPQAGNTPGGSAQAESHSSGPPDRKDDSHPQEAHQPPDEGSKRGPASKAMSQLLRWLLIAALAALLVWWLVRYRRAIGQAIGALTRSLVESVRQFIRTISAFLLALFRRRREAEAGVEAAQAQPMLRRFAAYDNPFVTGKDKDWSPEQLLVYTYEAVQAWSREQGLAFERRETPREFCRRVAERFPEFGPELEHFSFLYSHAAFAKQLPEDYEPESIRRLWQYLGDSVAVASAR